MARTKAERVTPKEFIDAWKAEVKAEGSIPGVIKRLGNRMSRTAVAARAASYRRRKVDLGKFAAGSRSFDWDGLRAYAGVAAKSKNGSKAKNGKATKRKIKAK